MKNLYEKMVLIREFELAVLSLFEQSKLFGTTHAYIGQEANAVGVISNLRKKDTVVSNHRCHGHYLAHKDNPYGLLCEMMGKSDGLCSGRGGSQHICDEGFYSNGIQGGIVPLAAGLAYSNKSLQTGNIVVVFIGDGTLGQGVVYETLNISAKWKLPLMFVVENNRYAQSTKVEYTLAGNIADRFNSFSIGTKELSTFDVIDISNTSEKIINSVRNECKPYCLILNTYRFASHSKSDDGRDPIEVEEWKKKDPLKIAETRLNNEHISKIRQKTQKRIEQIVEKAQNAAIAK